MAAAVLEVAVLAGAGVEERPEAVRGLGRRRRDHPVARKMPLPTLKSARSSNDEAVRGLREGVAGEGRAVVAVPPESASQRSALVKSVVGARIAARAARRSSQRARRAAGNAADATPPAQRQQSDYGPSPHAPPPLTGTRPPDCRGCRSPRARSARGRAPRRSRSIVLVWSIRPSIAAWTMALPSALPSPIIWS